MTEAKESTQKISRLKHWNPINSVIVTLGGYVLSQIVAVIIFVVYVRIRGWSGEVATTAIKDSVWLTFAYSLTVYGFYLLLVDKFLNWTGHKRKELGLKMTKSKLEIPYYVFGGWAVYFVLALIATIVVKEVLPSVDFEQSQELGISLSTTGWALLPVFLTLVVVPPVAEEIVCRGFLYTGLRKNLNIIWAGIITSIIFAMAHLQWGSGAPLLWAAAIDTFVLSAVLIYVREKTDSLVPAIGIHMLKNFMAFLALFVFKLAV